MKRIIKPGNVGRTTCSSCGCEFSFEREDVYFGSQFDPDNLVECPCCGKSIAINFSIIPLLKEGDKK